MTMKTMQTVEPGIYRRVDPRSGKVLPKLWIHYPKPGGGTEREPAHTTSLVTARKLRAKRLAEAGCGEPGRSAEQVTITTLLDALLVNYETNKRRSLPALRAFLGVLRPALGHLRAVACTTDRIERLQRAWQQAGASNATINRRCSALRRAFVLAVRARTLHHVPYVPRLVEHSPRGRCITPTDAALLHTHLPDHLRIPFAFAYANGIRKGQLARTLRRFVHLDRGVIVWPPEECKHQEPHTLPLDDTSLALIEPLLRHPPLYCPYLFHGRHCAPGRPPTAHYGCLGESRSGWRSACVAAGFPIGRKAGGYVFHHTRNTAATMLRAGGMDEADVMEIGGWKTAHVFRNYNLGDVDALRARLSRARATLATVTPLRRTGGEE
jgi:integrase